MFFAEKLPAHIVPGDCLLIPGRRSDPRGWFYAATYDGGFNVNGQPVSTIQPAVSAASIELAATRHLGMVTAAEAAEKDARIAEKDARIAQLEDELLDADSALEGVDALTRKGFQVRKTPGRKPNPKKQEQ